MKLNVVAWLNLFVGSLYLLGALLLAVTLSLSPSETRHLGHPLQLVLLLGGLGHLVGAVGVFLRRQWGRWVLLALSMVQVLNIPLGLVVALPTLMVLFPADLSDDPLPTILPSLGWATGLTAAAAALVSVPILLLGGMVGAMTWMVDRDIQATPAQRAAICKLSDLPGGLVDPDEIYDADLIFYDYNARAGDVRMQARIGPLDKQAVPVEDLDQNTGAAVLFGLKTGLRFTRQEGQPFGAAHGYWATADDGEGVVMDIVDDNLRVTVSVAGLEPADLAELESWFSRCYDAAVALGE